MRRDGSGCREEGPAQPRMPSACSSLRPKKYESRPRRRPRLISQSCSGNLNAFEDRPVGPCKAVPDMHSADPKQKATDSARMHERGGTVRRRLALLAACAGVSLVCACAGPMTRPEASGQSGPAAERGAARNASSSTAASVQTQTIDGVSVSAWIVPDAEAQRRYGVDLRAKGLQAVWLRVENGSPHELWLLATFTDPNYFSADEAAYLFSWSTSDEAFGPLRQRFRDLAMRARLKAGKAYEGHLLVTRAEGGRYVEVIINGHAQARRYGFALRTPDGHFDFEGMNPAAIYPDTPRKDLTREELRAALEELPCCATDAGGANAGDPLNFVVIGEPTQVMAALSQSGWSFTHRIDWTTVRRMIASALAGTQYPNAPVSDLFVFGRRQDLAFQRARFTLAQRNHMRLWLAPYTFEGRSVWIGQVSRDIGIKLTRKSPTFTTHVIDSLVDETRQYLLESLLHRNLVAEFGFVRAFDEANLDQPRYNLTDDRYISDGLRLVMMLSTQPVRIEDVRNLGWRQTTLGPIERGQTDAANARQPPPVEGELENADGQ